MPGSHRVLKARCPSSSAPRRGRHKAQKKPSGRNAKVSRRVSKKASPKRDIEPVRHYGESWEFEHYEKENLKASGLFL